LIEHGAGRVSAFDLSGEAVHQAAGKYRDWGIADRVDVVQMAAERLAYRSESFDAAVGNAILHHVDLDLALPELARVLKPGGRGYFMEPLAHNPLINLYRKRTPEARTEDERPFRFRDIEGFGRYFSKVSHRPVYLVTPIAMMSALVIKSDAFFERMLSLMWKLDGPTLKVLPFLKKMCWVTIVTLEK
jgi:ubiquinone/menaquinone biosynthesis C-methylase UbiE